MLEAEPYWSSTAVAHRIFWGVKMGTLSRLFVRWRTDLDGDCTDRHRAGVSRGKLWWRYRERDGRRRSAWRNLLIGGSRNSIALLLLSIEDTSGLNVGAGIVRSDVGLPTKDSLACTCGRLHCGDAV